MHTAALVRIALAVLVPLHGLAASLEARVRDRAGQPVTDAVVVATPASGPIETRARKLVSVEQYDREFVPYVSVIQTGTAVTFPNRDPILHHVYSFSPAMTFQTKLYTGNSPEYLFDKPGVVTLGCNIHDWMIGYILVVSTPYFGKTDAKGVAALRDVPSGTYELRVWHPQQASELPPQSMAIDGRAQAQFTLEVVPRKTKYKPPLDRLKY